MPPISSEPLGLPFSPPEYPLVAVSKRSAPPTATFHAEGEPNFGRSPLIVPWSICIVPVNEMELGANTHSPAPVLTIFVTVVGNASVYDHVSPASTSMSSVLPSAESVASPAVASEQTILPTTSNTDFFISLRFLPSARTAHAARRVDLLQFCVWLSYHTPAFFSSRPQPRDSPRQLRARGRKEVLARAAATTRHSQNGRDIQALIYHLKITIVPPRRA